MANIRRLKSLRAFLDTVPKERFNLGAWAETPGTPNTSDYDAELNFNKTFASPQKLKTAACGTTACVLGWAAVKPSFRKAGLKFHRVCTCLGTTSAVVQYEGNDGFHAGKSFFKIDAIAAEYLFSPEQYGEKRGLSEVKRRLDIVIRNNGTAPKGRRSNYWA